MILKLYELLFVLTLAALLGLSVVSCAEKYPHKKAPEPKQQTHATATVPLLRSLLAN